VTLVRGDTPSWQVPVNLTVTDACQLLIQIEVTNVPLGCAVQFTCGAPGPSPQLTLNKTVITTLPFQSVGLWSQIPAGFSADVMVSFWLNNVTALPSGAQVALCAYRVLPTSHPLAAFGTPIEQSAIDRNLLGTFTDMEGPAVVAVIGRYVVKAA
jgi:hypothetical protein